MKAVLLDQVNEIIVIVVQQRKSGIAMYRNFTRSIITCHNANSLFTTLPAFQVYSSRRYRDNRCFHACHERISRTLDSRLQDFSRDTDTRSAWHGNKISIDVNSFTSFHLFVIPIFFNGSSIISRHVKFTNPYRSSRNARDSYENDLNSRKTRVRRMGEIFE